MGNNSNYRAQVAETLPLTVGNGQVDYRTDPITKSVIPFEKMAVLAQSTTKQYGFDFISLNQPEKLNLNVKG